MSQDVPMPAPDAPVSSDAALGEPRESSPPPEPVADVQPAEAAQSAPDTTPADTSAPGAGPVTGKTDAAGEPSTPRPDLTADSMPLVQVLEAILFSTDLPLSAGKLAEIVGLDTTKPIKHALDELNRVYEERQASYRIEERAGGFQLLTLPQYAQYIERLARKKDDGRLTPAGLETLAIVAYKQPITRAGIEAIRGVACGEVLRSLMEHNLVKIVGRAEEIGRPMLYGTTRYFLEVFGLANIKDLPKSDSLREPK
jgi:segregation and condensation protein B